MKRKKHKMTNTKIYISWKNIKQRCYNIKSKRYVNYGGRGIEMCDEWKNDFTLFYTWATCNGYRDDLSIDRINNDGNYEPGNCRWTSNSIQSRNTRKNTRNTSGYSGVSFVKEKNSWMVQISTNNWRFRKAGYKTAEEAGYAYDKYVIDNNLEHTTNGLYKGDTV